MKTIIICTLTLLPMAVIAQPQRSQLEQAKVTLDELEAGDTDKDGFTSIEEVKIVRTREFGVLAAGQSEIDPANFPASPQVQARMLSNMDKDGNGKLSETEFVNGRPPIWNRLDQDGDNRISREEINDARAMLANMGG